MLRDKDYIAILGSPRAVITKGLLVGNGITEQIQGSVTINPAKWEPRFSNEYLATLKEVNEIFKGRTTVIDKNQELSASVADKYGDYAEIFALKVLAHQVGISPINPGGQLKDLWPRDMFTQLQDCLFIHPHVNPRLNQVDVKSSVLGEGGATLASEKRIITVDLAFNYMGSDVNEQLSRDGYKISSIPSVMPEAQPIGKRNIAQDHIDGHSSLLSEDTKGFFLYGTSYAEQSPQTREQLKRAAQRVDAEPIEIDDSNLHHLAFNMVETPSGVVIYSPTGKWVNGKYQDSPLDIALKKIKPADKLKPTSIPVEMLPVYAGGGIRCLVNFIDIGLLRKALQHGL